VTVWSINTWYQLYEPDLLFCHHYYTTYGFNQSAAFGITLVHIDEYFACCKQMYLCLTRMRFLVYFVEHIDGVML
jgi:hypothetical protein